MRRRSVKHGVPTSDLVREKLGPVDPDLERFMNGAICKSCPPWGLFVGLELRQSVSLLAASGVCCTDTQLLTGTRYPFFLSAAAEELQRRREQAVAAGEAEFVDGPLTPDGTPFEDGFDPGE